MKYKVILASFDVSEYPPRAVQLETHEGTDRFYTTEIVDTSTNVLFDHCENVHDVEDVMLHFWNRLNPSSKDAPHYTHNPREKVVVVHVEPVTGGDA